MKESNVPTDLIHEFADGRDRRHVHMMVDDMLDAIALDRIEPSDDRVVVGSIHNGNYRSCAKFYGDSWGIEAHI